jgi:UDP-N-acetylglucosamine 2-epimerase (non-hydrolysing)
MNIAVVFGTRPEIIRLSRIIPLLDQFCQVTLVHTGQNYDDRLSDLFFRELGVRAPDVHLGVRAGSFSEQGGQILERTGDLFARSRPDRILILGDTNSGLAAIIGARMGVPVYHMEAGNRCYDDRVPEEINRRIIDHCSNVLLPYTHRSKENLLREGIERQRIFVTGNPIFEVLEAYDGGIEASDVMTRLGLSAGQYFLVTLHRAENVDAPARLARLFAALARVADTYAEPLVVSLHPRTADKLERFGLSPESPRIKLLEPMGFFDFVHLERRARCVLSDSGTVQEECAIFHVPSVTLRDVTERPETIEAGSNIITGSDPDTVLRAVQVALGTPRTWNTPAEYIEPHVSAVVVRILMGYDGRS